MAWASCTVNVLVAPPALLTPPVVVAPGLMVIRLAPMREMLERILAVVPLPMDISAITAATPMTMPSIVKKLRSL